MVEPTHLKKYDMDKLDHFPGDRGEHEKKQLEAPPRTYVESKKKWATKKNAYFPLYWLFNRDPYFMVYEIIPT